MSLTPLKVNITSDTIILPVPFFNYTVPLYGVYIYPSQIEGLKSIGYDVEILSDEEPVVEEPIVEIIAEEQVITTTEPIQEPPAVEEKYELIQDESTMSEEDLIKLKDEVLALSSVAAAKKLIAEYGFEIDPAIIKLTDIKNELVKIIDGE
jgi:hypothetical protein